MKHQYLSQPRKRLLKLMQDISFGRFENLTIHEGEPVFDPPMRIVREVLLGRRGHNKPTSPSREYELKTQTVELFEYFDRVQNGMIPLLKVQDGLPFQLQLEEPVIQ